MGKLIAAVGSIGLVSIAFYGFILFIATKMFEYSLFSIFGKDVPWYLDLLGAVVFNGVNFLVFVVCLIARAAGVEVPFYGG